MAEELPTSTMLGEPGDSCGSCGNPLAVDQRYCLNCGARRSGPRLDYVEYLGGGSESGPGQPATAEPEPVRAAAPQGPRESSPLIAVGGIGILGLMLLVGVLIGRGGGDTEAAPSIVQVPAGGAAVAETTDPAAETETATNEKGGGGSDGGDSKGGGGGGGGSAVVEEPEQISTDELEALENASGDDYAEASENLPDTIQLPGEPPPKDNVDPGGGTDANVIE